MTTQEMVRQALDAGPTIRPLTDREFEKLRRLVYDEVGIHLGPAKKALVAGRLLARVRSLGLGSYGEYYRHVTEVDREEQVHLVDCICTNETHFFREPRQFAYLEQEVFPRWEAMAAAGARHRIVRAWSAACSTGEEPYSLAMLLLEHFPAARGWQVQVVGSDVSTRVLERARAGIWPMRKASEIPRPLLKKYMLRGTNSQEGAFAADENLRSVVELRRVNLNDSVYPFTERFDLLFCRNVLIYFSAESKRHVLERLLGRVADDGYLLLGHAESLSGLSTRGRSVGPSIFCVGSGATP